MKVDLKKTDPGYYKAGAKADINHYGECKYISISGEGAPESREFELSMSALYKTAYSLKSYYKQKNSDFVVSKLEGEWWANDLDNRTFNEIPREKWKWNLLIRVPDFVRKSEYNELMTNLSRESSDPLLRNISWNEQNLGDCINVLHIGSYEEEEKSIAKILDKMKEHNLEMNGRHREIYISDPRRTAEWKLKTIIRYPVKPSGN